jgi:FtsH-binding integral membrane protein
VTQPATSISGLPRALLVASRLCWLWGIFRALTAVVLLLAGAIPTLGSHPAFWLSFSFVSGVAYCLAGYLLSKARLLGGWIAVILAGVFVTREIRGLLAGSPGAFLTTVLNGVIVLSVVLNWRHLQGAGSQAGA